MTEEPDMTHAHPCECDLTDDHGEAAELRRRAAEAIERVRPGGILSTPGDLSAALFVLYDLASAYDRLLTAHPVAQEPMAWRIDNLLVGGAALFTDDAEHARLAAEYRYDGKQTSRVTPLYAHPATPAPVEAGLADLIEPLEKGVVASGLHEDNSTELYLVDDATDTMAEAAAALRGQSAPVGGLSQAALDVLAERQRQISAEGWTPEHDDKHDHGQMAGAALCYLAEDIPHWARQQAQGCYWPWDAEWWKPTDPRRNLVKAGALILAEIERLDRAAPVGGEGGDA